MTPDRIKRWAIAVLAILLMSSVGLNLMLASRSRQDYLDLNQARLDPLGLVGYTADDEQVMEVSTDAAKIVFFGDSRAHDWTAPANAPGFRFINRGIEAQTSEQVLARFDAHLAPLDPDVVVLQVGINDLKTIPLFPQRKDAIVERCEQNIESIVRKSRDLGAVVVVTTIFPVGEVPLERRPFWSSDVGEAVDTVNEFIRSLESPGVVVLGSDILKGPDGTLKREYSRDTLHLNAAGYEALNKQLRPILVSVAE